MNHEIYMANSSLLTAACAAHWLHFSEDHGLSDINDEIERVRYWMKQAEAYLTAYEASKVEAIQKATGGVK